MLSLRLHRCTKQSSCIHNSHTYTQREVTVDDSRLIFIRRNTKTEEGYSMRFSTINSMQSNRGLHVIYAVNLCTPPNNNFAYCTNIVNSLFEMKNDVPHFIDFVGDVLRENHANEERRERAGIREIFWMTNDWMDHTFHITIWQHHSGSERVIFFGFDFPIVEAVDVPYRTIEKKTEKKKISNSELNTIGREKMKLWRQYEKSWSENLSPIWF